MTRRQRRLTEDERALWQRVARSAKRLNPDRRHVALTPEDRSKEFSETVSSSSRSAETPLEPFEIGSARKSHSGGWSSRRDATDSQAMPPVRMDDKAYRKLRRGKLKPQARLDLHGMTLAEARPALTGFILRAQTQGFRMVLVITGKGRERDADGPIPTRAGALRHSVPGWLQAPPLVSAVLQVAPAHLRHGGDGALYVYLKRRR